MTDVYVCISVCMYVCMHGMYVIPVRQHRWNYVVARFFAKLGIKHIELYNEPDKTSCLTDVTLLDEIRVRSLATQHAYTDYYSWLGTTYQAPNIMIPPQGSPGW